MRIGNKRYKLKKPFKIALCILAIIIILIVIGFYINYRLSNTYAFKKMGYTKEQTEYLVSLDEGFQEKLLNMDFDPDLLKLLKQKYFIQKNFDRYLKFSDKNKKMDYKDVVTLVNVNRDREYYKDTKETNAEKNELMLVNKYYYLTEKYVPNDVIGVSSTYAYDGIKTSKNILEKYKKMFEAAKKDKINLVIISGYRPYSSQKQVYEEYVNQYGEDYADRYAAHPGFSEHQTGYSYDLGKLGVTSDKFDKTNEFKWLINNSYKYGFILRYPKDKENITGFKYESWHYRYVGEKAAKIIHDENITFDEYYAYYIEK